ncbi:uncharacterized protein LOC111024004 [Momordica charantia]|uniref:Uncharacterized protein LOC111024004 n=1 Tax=Momordica charantia TaxID=3673 RepID=A0A6J1DSK5_MOMCH|nr:uncharacterized protein LOC111024004 [Momordica charantia]
MCVLTYISYLLNKCKKKTCKKFLVVDPDNIVPQIMSQETCSRHLANRLLKMWQAKHSTQQSRSTTIWKPVKCPRQLGSIECGYYLQMYIREIVRNPHAPITELFNTKSAYQQEEIDEVRIEWTSFVGRFV